jgi:hypothetical protein
LVCDQFTQGLNGRRQHISQGPLRGLVAGIMPQLSEQVIVSGIEFRRLGELLQLSRRNSKFLGDLWPLAFLFEIQE